VGDTALPQAFRHADMHTGNNAWPPNTGVSAQGHLRLANTPGMLLTIQKSRLDFDADRPIVV